MGILRGIDESEIEPLVETVISAGLKTIEITMNTPDAVNLIRKMIKTSRGCLTVGAGTVITKKDLDEALDAGATFIVLPTLVKDVVEYCVKKGIPVFPGALTPQEILNASLCGATMVKVFPAKFFGLDYFKELKCPFPNIKLLACGGVREENVADYLSSGASAVAFGRSVFRKELLDKVSFMFRD